MYNKPVVLHILQLLHDSLIQIIKRSSAIHSPNDFLSSESGVTLLDSICIKLIAIGGSIAERFIRSLSGERKNSLFFGSDDESIGSLPYDHIHLQDTGCFCLAIL